MASSLSDKILDLPDDIVRASPGLAFDIGSSVAKIVYRSNKEYKNGIPCGNEGDRKTGRVHLAMFPRENTDDVIAFIDENCDFTRDEEGVAHISATGVGGSQFKSKMEEKLKIKIKVLPEFDCFVKTFKKLSKTLSKDRLLHPISDEGKARGEEMERVSKVFVEKSKDFMEAGFAEFGSDGEATGVEEDEDLLPCMIVMIGSGGGLMKINKDGSSQLVDGMYMAGRSFLGMVAASTAERNFNKMMEKAAIADGRTATTFTSDLRPEGGQEEDTYSMMMKHDFPIFPMGKVYTQDKEDVKEGDIIQSLYLLLNMVHGQIVQIQCLLNKVKNAYFCGNFIDNEVARTNITMIAMGRNVMLPPEMKVNMHFLRNGGVYGALGAFFDSSANGAPTAKSTATDTAKSTATDTAKATATDTAKATATDTAKGTATDTAKATATEDNEP